MEEKYHQEIKQTNASYDNHVTEKRGCKRMLAGMVACAVLGLAGLGFGVYEFIKPKTISDLKVEITKTDGTTTIIETPEIKTTTDDGTMIAIADSSIKAENTEVYLYIGEWGIKIRIPADLKLASYSFRKWSDAEADGETLCVSAALTGYETTSKFITPSGCITRNTRSASEEIDTYWQHKIQPGEFYIQGPQAVFNEEQIDIDCETASVNRIVEWFSDKTARSDI